MAITDEKLKNAVKQRIVELDDDVLTCEYYLNMTGQTSDKILAYTKLIKILKNSAVALRARL